MSAKLFGRVVRIAAGPHTPGATGAFAAIESGMGFDLSNVDAVFSAKKTLKPEPNTCDLRVFNLRPETRAVLQNAKRLLLRLEAGYEGHVSQLYLGEVRSAHSFREGADIVTQISTGDSDKELQRSRVSFALGPDEALANVLVAIAGALGVGPGNVPQVAARLQAKGVAFFGEGSALFGNAATALTNFCNSVGLEWSIQDRQLQLLDRNGALEVRGVVLSAATGLVGSPTIDHKGQISATALIQPDLQPGRYVQIKSLAYNGTFRITDVEFSGDTRGNDWYAKLTGKAPKRA